MLSHGELEANEKFVKEFLPTFQANVNSPEDQVKKLYRFADVSTANRVDIEGLIAKIMINKGVDRKSTRLNSSHPSQPRMPSSA